MTKAEWFWAYSESHRHPVNLKIHKICVPAIVYAQTGLLWAIPSPAGWPPGIFAVTELFLALLFYLSWRDPILVLKMFVYYVLPNVAFWYYLARVQPKAVLPLAAAVFIAAWIGQFVGHKIEGKKPSFFQDLQFLLIGPAWILGR
jgi:uncharacterized membrane protein YGL010W